MAVFLQLNYNSFLYDSDDGCTVYPLIVHKDFNFYYSIKDII